MSFFFEVLIGGLLSGVMYSLVALGFVLIYKASGVFNFAQGAMVFFAATGECAEIPALVARDVSGTEPEGTVFASPLQFIELFLAAVIMQHMLHHILGHAAGEAVIHQPNDRHPPRQVGVLH